MVVNDKLFMKKIIWKDLYSPGLQMFKMFIKTELVVAHLRPQEKSAEVSLL